RLFALPSHAAESVGQPGARIASPCVLSDFPQGELCAVTCVKHDGDLIWDTIAARSVQDDLDPLIGELCRLAECGCSRQDGRAADECKPSTVTQAAGLSGSGR